MTRTLTVVLALLFSGTAVQAAGPIVAFHATLQLVEDCESSTEPSEQCQQFPAWLATCQAQGYDWAFQSVRTGQASYMGHVTAFEQGCLDFPESGPGAIVRSYLRETITARRGDTLTFFAAGLFDFAQENAPGTGTFSITGGTGRFAGALGGGTNGNVKVGGNPGFIVYLDGFLRLSVGAR